jgi:hypothetical protein
LPRSCGDDAVRFAGPRETFELLRRPALPAAAGGCPAGEIPAAPRTNVPAARRRLLFVLVVSALLAILAASSAYAEEVFTGQAAAANALDSTWIPAPARKAALCIVDTGNDVTPDTANVVARFAPDGGTVSDRNHAHHGTLMSMIASAPYDGFGMVGAAPSINVVSVAASANGEQFGGTDLQTAIQTCISHRNIYNIKAISLSLGAPYSRAGGNQAQVADTETMVKQARNAGLNVVAAAGNSASGVVDWPAGYEPTFAVGAADDSGVRCSFGSWGTAVDIWAPGCPLDVGHPDAAGGAAWASGSSEATVVVAAILTQLRGLDDALTPDGAEQLLKSNATAMLAGAYLNVGATFVADGLAERLAVGHGATPRQTPRSGGVTTDVDSAPAAGTPAAGTGSSPAQTTAGIKKSVATKARARLSRPMVRSVTSRRGLLTIVLTAKPRGTEARVHVYSLRAGHAFPSLTRILRMPGDRLSARVSGMVSQVSITYRDPTKVRLTSAPVSLRPRK